MNSTWLYPYKMLRFLFFVVKQRGWVEYQGDGFVDREYWGRKIWLFRPRFGGFIKELPCGCSKRFGKFVYYRFRCPENHGNLNKHLSNNENG